ncbi:MAG TPA: PspC domain-containing protein [Candidatus Limnocylindria bacterium]
MNRRLYRSRTDSIIGGVAAGLADYLGADPALVRVAWALIAIITGGAGIVAYVVAWIVVPEAPKGVASTTGSPALDPVTGQSDPSAPLPAASAADRRPSTNPGLLVGVGLVLLGAWFLAREYLPPIDWSLVWPVLLIGVGALILLTTARNRSV